MELPDALTLGALQRHIRAKDHNPEAKDAYFLKLVEEVGELAEVLLSGQRMEEASIKGTLEEELYDVLYYVAALANIYDIDLESCCRLKEAINLRRYGLDRPLGS